MFNKMIAAMLPFMPKSFVWIFSKRYIAGKKIGDAIKVSKELNSQGIKVTIDLLGEFITRLDEAEKNKLEYLDIIDTVVKQNIDGNFSLKPTMFGLLIDKDVCYANIREIVAKAASLNNFVRVDKEDSQCVDLEIELNLPYLHKRRMYENLDETYFYNAGNFIAGGYFICRLCTHPTR